jgi:hypothetical protein
VPTYVYKIEPYGVIVTLEAEDSNDPQSIRYEGNPLSVDMVKHQLSRAYGAFGHSFCPDGDTPTDLDAALFSVFGPDRVERLGATPDYDPGIPDGAVT